MLVDTGIAIGLPRETYSRLAARKGIASKHGIAVGGGVIDADYTDEIKVILLNHGNTSYEFKGCDRISQLIEYTSKHTMSSKSITLKTWEGKLGDWALVIWSQTANYV